MLSYVLMSSFFGATLGAIYGFLFVKRVKSFVVQKKSASLVGSFLLSYGLVAGTFFMLMRFCTIHIMWGLSLFLVAFWATVWKKSGRLSL